LRLQWRKGGGATTAQCAAGEMQLSDASFDRGAAAWHVRLDAPSERACANEL
jgi:hypothetical protein